MTEQKLPKRAIKIAKGFYKKFNFTDINSGKYEANEWEEESNLLNHFDKKTHSMCGNGDYRELLKPALEGFIEQDSGVWINDEIYETQVESGDGIVRVAYDKDMNSVSITLSRVIAEKDINLG